MIFQCKANRKAFDYELVITANAAETCRRTRRVQLMGARMLRKDNLRIAAYTMMPVYLVSFTLLRPKHRRGSISWDCSILCIEPWSLCIEPWSLCIEPWSSAVLPNARIASRDDGSIMLKIR